jgi:hypothetical protein
MEANIEWAALDACLDKLLPYAREFDKAVKHEVLDAIREVTARTRLGMPVEVARSVDTLLIDVMPLKAGDCDIRRDRKLRRRIMAATVEFMDKRAVGSRNAAL